MHYKETWRNCLSILGRSKFLFRKVEHTEIKTPSTREGVYVVKILSAEVIPLLDSRCLVTGSYICVESLQTTTLQAKTLVEVNVLFQ
jgi:uncharacterized protein (UPF0179 family)